VPGANCTTDDAARAHRAFVETGIVSPDRLEVTVEAGLEKVGINLGRGAVDDDLAEPLRECGGRIPSNGREESLGIHLG
jgi:hypothetical protein